ncbi:MAG TPA: O-antigen ligase family protein [Terriglobales bacterium]|nr:O-antigen ligase family protein [Terriglobales bacterium]
MKLLRIAFILTIVSFLATNFPIGAVGVYSRFGALALLIAVCLALVSRLRTRILSPLLVAIYVFLTYSFVTIFWTENLLLSFAKWVLYASLAFSLLLSGVIIGQGSKGENPFGPLKWGFIPMVLTSCYALIRGIGWVENNFRAYSGNSNALGASLMLTSPWLIYELKRSRGAPAWRRRLLYLLAAGMIAVTMETHSRAALVSLFVVVLISSRQTTTTGRMQIVYAISSILVLTYALSGSSLFDRFYYTFVQKNRSQIFASRGEQMDDSWQAAKEGGVFGAGFGVSIGVSRYWDANTTFSAASREKGNSTLAIVEETGLVGLFFYSVILLTLFLHFRRASHTNDPEQRFIALLGLGYFAAALLHGQFEAWFLSFGPDVSVYWGTLGLAIGALSREPAESLKTLPVPMTVTARA